MRTPNVKRYFVLRAVGVVYNVLSVLAIVITVVGFCYFVIDLAYGEHPDRYTASTNLRWILEGVAILGGGFLAALTLAVLGQLISLAVSINNNTRLLTDNTAQIVQAMKAIAEEQKRMDTNMQQLNRSTRIARDIENN